jgi:hypothetical protein
MELVFQDLPKAKEYVDTKVFCFARVFEIFCFASIFESQYNAYAWRDMKKENDDFLGTKDIFCQLPFFVAETAAGTAQVISKK